jgi:hypothetical protein
VSTRQIGKKHREPEPERYLHREKQVASMTSNNVPKNKQRREDTAHLNDEHYWIARNLPRINFLTASLMARFTIGGSKRGLFFAAFAICL